MKSLFRYSLTLALLTMVAACGKDNESGKNNNPYANSWQSNQYGVINSPYSYANISINEVINRNPCTAMGMPNQNRVQVQIPVPPLRVPVAANDIYVGVTSVGDVGVLVGQGNNQPMFIGYLCARGVTYPNQGTPMINDLDFGAKSMCAFKPITRATLMLPGMPVPIYFRWLDGGTSTRTSFGPPVCNI